MMEVTSRMSRMSHSSARFAVGLAVGLLLLATACSGGEDEDASGSSSSATTETPSSTSGAGPGTTSEGGSGAGAAEISEPLDVETGCTGYDPSAGTSAAPGGPSVLPEKEGAPVESPDTRFVTDWQGRVLIPRGTNVISASKGSPDRLGGVEEETVRVLAEEHGFNVVRHLILWDAIEPAQGVYNERYLDLVEQRLDWYAANGLYVILDMHQDIYSACFTGDGAPEWAVITDGAKFEVMEGAPWWMNNTDEAVQNATMNFFLPERGHPELREAYAAMWKHVVERFADHPAVLGYDIMNEPSFNSLGTAEEAAARAREAGETGDYRNQVLTAFMQENIDAIREADPNGYIVVSPVSLVNTLMIPGDLGEITDPRDGPPRLIYGPHLYDPRAHEGAPYEPELGYVEQWEELRVADAEKLNAALWIGEFGAGEVEGIDEYFGDITDMADRLFMGWAHWSWDPGGWGLRESLPDGPETPHSLRLTRPYPRVLAGIPTDFSFDPESAVMHLSWDPNPDAEGQTEMFVPSGHYPDGWVAVLDGEPLDAPDGDSAAGSTLAIEPDGEPHDLCIAKTVEDCAAN